MSSFRNHAIASIIMALPFVPSAFYLFFAFIGASIPDMDHENNNEKIFRMLIIGLVLSIALFFLNGSLMSGLIIVFLAITFYLSKHRGFTHSFVGIFVLTILFLLMIMGFLPLFTKLSNLIEYNIPSNVCIFLALAIVGYFIVHRAYLLFYWIFLAIYLFLYPLEYMFVEWNIAFIMLFLGALSHLILDMCTPAGLKALWPFSDVELHKSHGIIFILLWFLISFYVVSNFGCILTNFMPIFR